MEWMSGDLRLKRPANAEIQPYAPRSLMTAPYHQKHHLMAELRRLSSRGQVQPLHARPTWNPDAGQWEIPVLRLRSEPSKLRALWAASGIACALGAILGITWWFLISLTAASLLLLCGACLAGLWLLMHATRRQRITVTTTTTVDIR